MLYKLNNRRAIEEPGRSAVPEFYERIVHEAELRTVETAHDERAGHDWRLLAFLMASGSSAYRSARSSALLMHPTTSASFDRLGNTG
jgi:hypothetical protein